MSVLESTHRPAPSSDLGVERVDGHRPEADLPAQERRPDSDHAAFTAVYHRHLASVASYVARRCDSADAADVVSETFATAWRRWADIPGEPETRPWLIGVARNLLSNDRRRRRRQTRLVKTASDHLAPAIQQLYFENNIEDRSWLQSALGTLSELDRELILGTAWDGLTAAEMAAIVGISHESARQRIHRARNKLRYTLAATNQDLTWEES